MYNFDKKTNRFNELSYKWDVSKEVLPMWVADMDFEVCDEIVDAIKKRTESRIFGYNIVPKEWNEAICGFWKRRHNLVINSDELLFSTGVVPTISSVVRKLTTAAENVLIQTPVYNIFFNSILNNGRNVIENRLIYENGVYHIDFVDLEEKLKNPQTTLMILCNPQNPIGHIWGKSDLEKIGHLCKKYNVVVLSDEIHCDIVDPNLNYVPFASVNDECKYNSITCISPTKCFNIAGLQTSAIYIPNEFLRNKVKRAINTDEIAEPNTFAIQAAIAAFNYGDAWLDEMREYVYQNKLYVKKYLEENLKDIYLVPSNATYLLWLDISKITFDSVLLRDFIKEHTGLYLSDGLEYGIPGKSFLRMNIATNRFNIIDGLERLKRGILEFKKYQKPEIIEEKIEFNDICIESTNGVYDDGIWEGKPF